MNKSNKFSLRSESVPCVWCRSIGESTHRCRILDELRRRTDTQRLQVQQRSTERCRLMALDPDGLVDQQCETGAWLSGKPMRYQRRIDGKPPFYDRKLPETYNARRDNLEGF